MVILIGVLKQSLTRSKNIKFRGVELVKFSIIVNGEGLKVAAMTTAPIDFKCPEDCLQFYQIFVKLAGYQNKLKFCMSSNHSQIWLFPL